MTTPATPSAPQPSGDDRNLVPADVSAAVSFEDKVNQFWEKNHKTVIGLCAAVVVGFLAKGGWDHLEAQKELEVQSAYAAATTSDQLKAFAASHGSHRLAGLAQLRIADEAYAAGKGADALAGYEAAVGLVKDGPLAARARLGRALAKVLAGKGADATSDLKQLAGDAAAFKAIRAEATYHLASLAAEARDAAEVQKLSDQIMQLEPGSAWAARAMALRASLPAPAPTPSAPTDKKDGAAPAVKLPGK